MGQAPSAPETEKRYDTGQNKRVAYAVGSMQGWRDSMEDAHVTVLRMGEDDENTFFAVFDGHADQGAISGFAAEHVWKKLRDRKSVV